MHATVTWSLYT